MKSKRSEQQRKEKKCIYVYRRNDDFGPILQAMERDYKV